MMLVWCLITSPMSWRCRHGMLVWCLITSPMSWRCCHGSSCYCGVGFHCSAIQMYLGTATFNSSLFQNFFGIWILANAGYLFLPHIITNVLKMSSRTFNHVSVVLSARVSHVCAFVWYGTVHPNLASCFLASLVTVCRSLATYNVQYTMCSI